MNVTNDPPIRTKSRRTRIKEGRAKRHRRRFYVIIDGEQRARDTGVRRTHPIKMRLPNILQSLHHDYVVGKITLREAAVELHKAGWTPFVDLEKTVKLLAQPI